MSATVIPFKPKQAAAVEYLDQPPPGWFVLDVMRSKARSPIWVALMIDVHPEDFRAGRKPTRPSCWVRIAGKHRTRDAACGTIDDMMSTRH
jgi:hypothetical protein